MPRITDNPRNTTVYAKVPPIVKAELARIAEKEHRTESSLLYYFMLRGLKAYCEDGVLFEKVNEIEFLENPPAKKRKTGTR